MGGDMQWGPEGDVAQVAQSYGLDGEIKPLFAMQSWTGEAMSLFQVGSSEFFLYNAIDGSLYEIVQLNDLQSIVSVIGDPERGLGALDIEQR